MARAGGGDRGLFKRGNDWWIRWACHGCGGEHREKGGSKGLARQLYAQRKTETRVSGFCLTQERERQERQAQTRFSDVAERYLRWAEESRPRSLTFRSTAIKRLLEVFGSKSLDEITRGDVEAYQQKRQKDGVKPATANRERSVLSHIYKRALDWGLVQHNPVTGTEKLPEDSENPRPLSPEEESALFAVLPEHYKPFVTLALHTGLRLGELRAQAWVDVDLPGGTLKVTRPKSKKHEVIPLNSIAFSVLAGLEQGGEILFPSMPKKLSDLFIKYAKRAELGGCDIPLFAGHLHQQVGRTHRYRHADGLGQAQRLQDHEALCPYRWRPLATGSGEYCAR